MIVWKSIEATVATSSLAADGIKDAIVTGPALVWFPLAVVALSNGEVMAPVMSYSTTLQSPGVHGFIVSVMFPSDGLVLALGT